MYLSTGLWIGPNQTSSDRLDLCKVITKIHQMNTLQITLSVSTSNAYRLKEEKLQVTGKTGGSFSL